MPKQSPDLHVRDVHHISILVFGLYDHRGRPPTAYVVFVQDQRGLLGVCVGVWLQPPGWTKRDKTRETEQQILIGNNIKLQRES